MALSAGMADATAHAGEWSTVVEAARHDFHYETWGGGDGSGSALSLYGGMTASLFEDIRGNGVRLRTTASYGTYRYTRPYALAGGRAWQEFRGTMSSADLLLGYQHAFGPWIIKVFAGASQERHDIVAHGAGGLSIDDGNGVQGERLGFKGALETWLNIANVAFVQTDLSWSAPFKAYGTRVRAGYRLNPAFSTGLEAAVHGNANHDEGRLGAFLRFEWTGGEVSVSAGGAGNQRDVTGAYASVGLMLRF